MDKQNEHQLIERIVGNRIETNKRELGIDSLLPLWGFKGARPRLAPVSHYRYYEDPWEKLNELSDLFRGPYIQRA